MNELMYMDDSVRVCIQKGHLKKLDIADLHKMVFDLDGSDFKKNSFDTFRFN